MNDAPILLYDGLCGFCDRIVQFVLARDKRGAIKFATLQGSFARSVVARHPELKEIDSLILVEEPNTKNERVFVKSDGAFRVAHHLGAPWNLAGVYRIIPRFLRDAYYDFIAKNRNYLFARRTACRIPSPEQRDRFLLD